MSNIRIFSIRSSGIQEGKFYIDCDGYYTTDDMARLTGMEKPVLIQLYLDSGAQWDNRSGVYFFPSRTAAREVVRKLEENGETGCFGKLVFLTFEEIEYIRQALINEGSNIINVRNDLKKCIFDKFNS